LQKEGSKDARRLTKGRAKRNWNLFSTRRITEKGKILTKKESQGSRHALDRQLGVGMWCQKKTAISHKDHKPIKPQVIFENEKEGWTAKSWVIQRHRPLLDKCKRRMLSSGCP